MKKGYYRTDAVILNSTDYGESDSIITFYTERYGKLNGIAKGARRSRRRFVANLDPVSRSRLYFFQTGRSDLVRIEDATLVEGFPALKADIERYGSACYMVELLAEMTRDGQASPVVFDILLGFLRLLEEGGEEGLVMRFFEIKMLSALGYLPHLGGCVVCRNALNGEKVFFSSEKGGVVCKRCVEPPGDTIPVSAGTAGFLAMAARLPLEKLRRLVPSPLVAAESERVLADFIRYQIGKELKSRRFIQKLKGLSA